MKSFSFAVVLFGLTGGDCTGINGPVSPEYGGYAAETTSEVNIAGDWNIILWYLDDCPGVPNRLYSTGSLTLTAVNDHVTGVFTVDSLGAVRLAGTRDGGSLSLSSEDRTIAIAVTMISSRVWDGTLSIPTTYQPKCGAYPLNSFYFDMRR